MAQYGAHFMFVAGAGAGMYAPAIFGMKKPPEPAAVPAGPDGGGVGSAARMGGGACTCVEDAGSGCGEGAAAAAAALSAGGAVASTVSEGEGEDTSVEWAISAGRGGASLCFSSRTGGVCGCGAAAASAAATARCCCSSLARRALTFEGCGCSDCCGAAWKER